MLLVSMPPRHGKSELISRWTPEWYISLHPARRVLLVSYSAEMAEEWSRRVRNGLAEHGGEIASDKGTAAWWATAQGGSMSAAGMGGAITGKGADLIIIDDPIKNAEEAGSDTMRAKHKASFGSDIWTRRQNGCLVVLLMTRWHTDDLYAHVKAVAPDCEEIRIPALSAGEGDPLGRPEGAPLCPELITKEMILDAKRVLTPREYTSLFDQTPTDSEGQEIKRSWWKWYDELPVRQDQFDMRAMSVDATFRDSDGSDYVVIQAWGVYGTRRYLLGQHRERMGFVATVHAIAAMHERFRPSVTLIEAKANGDAIIEMLHRAGIAGVVPITPKASKLARARAASPQIEAGDVWLPKTRFAEELVEEAASFPLGKHDDMVDCASQLLNYLGDLRSTPRHELQASDDRWVSPSVAEDHKREGYGADPFASLMDKLRRSV